MSDLMLPASQAMLVPAQPEGAPRWALEVYDGSEEDFSKWLLSTIYWDIAKKKPSDQNLPVAEAIAEACMQRLKVTYNLKDVAERATVLQLWEAQKTEWYHFLPQRYDSVREILEGALGKAQEKQAESEIYDLSFWTDTLLPALEFLNHPVEQILKIPAKFSKARAAVPLLRRMWREMDTRYRGEAHFTQAHGEWRWSLGALSAGPFPSQEAALADYQKNFYQGIPVEDLDTFSAKLKSIIDGIIDSSSVRDYRKSVAILSGKFVAALPPAPARLYVLGPDEEWLVIQCTTRQAKLIEGRLGDLVSGMMPADYLNLLNDLNRLHKNQRKEAQMDMIYSLKEHAFLPNETGTEGILIPSHNEMRRLCLTALAQAYPYIVQNVLDNHTRIDVPVWEICPAESDPGSNFLRRMGMQPETMTEATKINLVGVLQEGLISLYQSVFKDASRQVLPAGVSGTMDVSPCGLSYLSLCYNLFAKGGSQ